jgi:hypothetical protein
MRVIWDDYIQSSDAPDFLKTPSLADKDALNGVTVTFTTERTYNAIGVGNTNAPEIIVNGQTVTLAQPDTNGLYMLPQTYTSSTVTLSISSEYTVGRVAVGTARSTPIAPAREPGLESTSNPRITLSNQVIAGVGGVSRRTFSVDMRYKFTKEIWDDIEAAYPQQIGRGFPLFVSFDDCNVAGHYPFPRLYAQPDAKFVFQSSVYRFLYSKKIKLTERF